MIQIAELINKIKRYNNISVYNRKNRFLPHIDGGIGAFGQDVFIAELLNHKKNGVFLDVGANDGVSINNSLYFEKHYDWTGIAVEPVEYIFKKLKANRRCHVVQGCISHRQGPAKFLQLIGDANMFSTLKSHNTGLTARRVRKRQKRQNSELKEIEVECFTISDLTRKFGYKNVDFLSLDTEGGELEILKSIDFAETPITAISVENNWRTPHIRNYLEECGYIYIGTFGVDEIYLFGGHGLREAVKR